MLPDVIVTVKEKTDVAAARREAVELAGLSHELAGKLSVLVTELASNLIKHAGGGQIAVLRSVNPGASVEIVSIDKGPGMANPARCFEDGYSTAGSSGTGLGAVTRIASYYDYYSAPDNGTVLMVRVGGREESAQDHPLEIGAISGAFPGETISGDSWAWFRRRQAFRMMIADGLGHGPLAAEASDLAIAVATTSPNLKSEDLIDSCHARLRPTRGAALSIADVDFEAQTLSFAGVGNVAGAIVTATGTRRQMVSVNGTVGHEMRTIHSYKYPLPVGSLVVMHSDGLSAGWGLDKYPGLLRRHPTVIAAVLFRDFVRGRDDATVLVARAARAAAA